jgi:hypothetical protein
MLLALVACSPPPDLKSVEAALGAAAPIAFAGAHAAGWALGTPLPCDDAAVLESGWAGNIAIGPDCPIPAVGDATGTVHAAGVLDDAGAGELAADFSGAAGVRPQGPAAFVNSADDDGLTVVFAGADVSIGDDVGLGESALVTGVDLGDRADGTDDLYTLNGGVQVVFTTGSDDAHTDQVVFVGVTLDAACGSNPTAGSVTIQQVDTRKDVSVDELQLGFHAACDGAVDVIVAVGASTAWTGRAVPIDLGD